jgi:hypothetical protein
MSDESLASQENLSSLSDDEPATVQTAIESRVEKPPSPVRKRSDTGARDQTSSSNLKPPNLQVTVDKFSNLSPMDPSYAPPPLSPRKPPAEFSSSNLDPNHLQPSDSSSQSWLGAKSIPSSASSSVQSLVEAQTHPSLTSSMDNTQAEFDAALDAAVEAAYDDGLETYDYYDPTPVNEKAPQLRPDRNRSQVEDMYDDAGMLNETHEQELEGFDFGLHSKSAPRQSDSSGYSGTTWHSSSSSSRATASTSLSTVAEGPDTTFLSSGKMLGGLPRLSEENSRGGSPHGSRPGSRGQQMKSTTESVRSRRLSGQNAKQLKIETQPISKAIPTHRKNSNAIQEENASNIRPPGTFQLELNSSDTSLHKVRSHPNGAPQLPPIPTSAGSRPLLSPAETAITISPATPGLTSMHSEDGNSPGGHRIPSNKPAFLRKNKSSLSLKNRAFSMSSPDGSDGSVATPLSTTSLSRKITNNARPSLPTPTFLSSPGGANIFKTDFHSQHSPGLPNPLISDGPAPLEPCPEPVHLRPFWLLRCVYQTIANPAGGYVSNRLFVTPAVWNTKGVKLRNVEDKIAACDTLTNALLRLPNVDSFDAQAVLDEMQALEAVLDSVQATIAKKLGHDVGVNGTAAFLKDAPASTTTPTSAPTSAGAENAQSGVPGRSSSKGYFSSLRKLRSKTSGNPLPVNGAKDTTSSGGRDGKSGSQGDASVGPKMASVPMTSLISVRLTKRNATALGDVTGPNAMYMVSLARLCDAVQYVGKFFNPLVHTL